MTKTVEERCRDVVATHLKIESERVTREAKFSDLGGDSLDNVEIVLELEEEFDIEISDDEAYDVATFGQAVAIVEGKVAVAA